MAPDYRFSFGPWNIHGGADPFGPVVRDEMTYAEKLTFYKKLGFDGIQFHDDDAVPELNELSPRQIANKAKAVREQLEDHGLAAEFVAPRLWEDPRTIDGAYTSNDRQHREYAIERSKRTIDIANELGTDLVVLWLAREGTYIRESKDSKKAVDLLVQALDAMLDYDPHMRIAIEPKPNEPMDQAFIPTTGHAIGLAYICRDPSRVGVNIESAHAILAGLDPSDEMGYALAHGKLWTVHLNDQNSLKFDEDKTFGSVDIRRAFNQVRLLEEYHYGQNGEYVGLDVKVMRTQKAAGSTQHLANSRTIFLRLVDLVRSLERQKMQDLIQQRDYEALDLLILNHLMGE